MSDRVNSDTNSDSCDESFYDPEVASDSEDFSDGDFNVIDDDGVDDINNIISLRMSWNPRMAPSTTPKILNYSWDQEEVYKTQHKHPIT